MHGYLYIYYNFFNELVYDDMSIIFFILHHTFSFDNNNNVDFLEIKNTVIESTLQQSTGMHE